MAIDVNEAILSIQPLLKSAIGAKVDLDIALWPGKCTALLDKTQFEFALLNLVIDAGNAMSRGELELFTEVIERRAPRAPQVDTEKIIIISAVGDGHGMSDPLVTRTAKSNFATKACDNGTGLGLGMVSAFVEQAAGCMEILSQVGAGTALRLYLPCLSDDAGVRAPQAGAL